MNHTITLNTVRYFKRIMRPLAEDGIIPLPEYHEVISQLTSLAEHGIPKPTVVPKLIDQREAAEMLGIGLSNFKKLEGKLIPEDIDYGRIEGLRLEARQKLSRIRPANIGQAGRISGVSPADISVLLVALEQFKGARG